MDTPSIPPIIKIESCLPDYFDVAGFASYAKGGLDAGNVGGVAYAINIFQPDEYSDEQLVHLVAYYQETYQSDLAEDIFRMYHHCGATNGNVIAFAARLNHLVAGENPGIRETIIAQDEEAEKNKD